MYKGSNAEKLNNMSLYDLLILMNRNIQKQQNSDDDLTCACIMDGFGLDLEYMRTKCEKFGANCESCVMEFLNEEYDGRW